MALIYKHQLHLSGSIPIHGGVFTDMGMPTGSYDSANKKYVDDLVQVVVTGSNRFTGLVDTPHVIRPNRIYYADGVNVSDNENLQFLSSNTLLVGGNVILKPNSVSGELPKIYFDYASGSYKLSLDTKTNGDLAFKSSGSSDVFYLSNNFVRSNVDLQVTGSAHVSQILGFGDDDQVQMYYSSSGVSPNKTVYMFAKMENDEKVIVASRVV